MSQFKSTVPIAPTESLEFRPFKARLFPNGVVDPKRSGLLKRSSLEFRLIDHILVVLVGKKFRAEQSANTLISLEVQYLLEQATGSHHSCASTLDNVLYIYSQSSSFCHPLRSDCTLKVADLLPCWTRRSTPSCTVRMLRTCRRYGSPVASRSKIQRLHGCMYSSRSFIVA